MLSPIRQLPGMNLVLRSLFFTSFERYLVIIVSAVCDFKACRFGHLGRWIMVLMWSFGRKMLIKQGTGSKSVESL